MKTLYHISLELQ